MKDKPVFCKDCKFSEKSLFFFTPSYAKCKHKEAVENENLSFEYYVTGAKSRKEYRYCCVMRVGKYLCGEDARLFEPRWSKKNKDGN